MHNAVREDRLWFQNNPSPSFASELPHLKFTALYALGEQPPFFRPSVCRSSAPLRWVAVIDLMRMAGAPSTDLEERTARLRIRIPAIRSFKRQEAAKAELLEAIAVEMLKNLESEQSAFAA